MHSRMSQTWSSLPALPHPVMKPTEPKFASALKVDDVEAKNSQPALTKESLPSMPGSSPEKTRRPEQRVNSKFIVNPSMTGMLHHGARDRLKKRAESCGPGYTP